MKKMVQVIVTNKKALYLLVTSIVAFIVIAGFALPCLFSSNSIIESSPAINGTTNPSESKSPPNVSDNNFSVYDGAQTISNRSSGKIQSQYASTSDTQTVFSPSQIVAYPPAFTVDPSNEFSIIQITDTQYMPANPGAEVYFNDLCRWIVSQKQPLNIKMVIHTGDIVGNGSNSLEWQNANDAIDILRINNVPYCWDAGNHDQNGWIGNLYPAFDPILMHTQPYWISDSGNGRNTAVRFSMGDYSFLVINLEFQQSFLTYANDTVWMTDLLNQYSNDTVIVASHSILDYNGRFLYSAKPLNAIMDKYPNVILSLCGHDNTLPFTTNMTRSGSRLDVVFNNQGNDWPLGSATARIYTFNMVNQTCSVSTYQVYKNAWLIDAYNQFTFNFTLNRSSSLVE